MLNELMIMNDLQYHRPICMRCQNFIKCPGKQPDCQEFLEEEDDEYMMNS